MFNKTETVNTVVNTIVNGNSVIKNEDTGDEVVVATMSVTVSRRDGKIVNYTQAYHTILDADMYNANLEVCKSDFKEFDDYVDTLLAEEIQ